MEHQDHQWPAFVRLPMGKLVAFAADGRIV